jgi:hypothetical protein
MDRPWLRILVRILLTAAVAGLAVFLIRRRWRRTVAENYPVTLNTTRNALLGLPSDVQRTEARRHVKMFLVPADSSQSVSDGMIPDYLVSESMVDRYLQVKPPVAAIMPDFQTVIDEIEEAYVRGHFFSALSAACVSIERLLNLARIELHKHHRKIKELWDKGPSNDWDENIDALQTWGYLDDEFASELKWVFKNIRCRYLHSRPITDLRGDALRSVNAAYQLLSIFLGFPDDLFRFTSGIECTNPADPRFIEFYRPRIVSEQE